MSTDEIVDTQPAVPVVPPSASGDSRVRTRTRTRTRARTRFSARLAGRAPAPPSPGAALHNISAATAVLLVLVAIGSVIHEPVLIPPLAASAAIIHCAPGLPLAQPRSVIAGHLLCSAVGYAVLAVAGSSPWAAALAPGSGSP